MLLSKKVSVKPTTHDIDRYEFEKALQIRQNEIDLFWKRAWFFGALLIALITAYISLKNSGQPVLGVCISFVIFLVSIAQALMNRGSKYWQERWEFKTKNKESRLRVNLTKTNELDDERYYIDANIRAKGENILTRSCRISVSKLAFLAWDIVSILFFSLWITDLIFTFYPALYKSISPEIPIILFHAIIICYILIFFFRGKIYEPLLKDPNPKGSDRRINKYTPDAEKYLNNNQILQKDPYS